MNTLKGIPNFDMSDSPKGMLILLPKQKYQTEIILAGLTAGPSLQSCKTLDYKLHEQMD